MSYLVALRRRNTPSDKRLVRGRLWYTGRGDKTTSLECPLEWADWAENVRLEVATYVIAKETPADQLATLPKTIKKSGGSRLSKIELAPQWQCDYCDFCGLSCVPHDMKANALLYKQGKEWKVSKLGRTMAKEVLEQTGVNFDNLDLFDTGWGGPVDDTGEEL
jgi:hypothetical protein